MALTRAHLYSVRTGSFFMASGIFGERLKRERELREISLDELSKSTRISSRFLDALENEDWQKLPGGVFGHGFVRTIARYLGLDEEALLAEYDLARADKLPPPPSKTEERIPSPPKWVPAAVILATLLLLLVLFFAVRYGWRRFVTHRISRNNASFQTPNGRGSTSPASSAESSLDFPLDLSVSTASPAHLRIIGDDKLLLGAYLPVGETRHLITKQRLEVSASDSSAVLLQLNGRALAPLGAPCTSRRMVIALKI